MQFAQLVSTSEVVGSTRSRLKKMSALAALFEQLTIDTARIAVCYLCGHLPQGKIGLGPAILRDLAPPDAVGESALHLSDVDDAFSALAEISGAGANAKRKARLERLFAHATDAERTFLSRLIVGELRQGALEGVMAEALARATQTASSEVRRAVMLAGDPAPVAEALITHGPEGLAQFKLVPGRPVQSMLASPTEGVEDALARLDIVRLEYKMDGARIQAHRSGPDVQVFSRRLNDVTASVPEVVEAVQQFDAENFILDGEAIALADDDRPLPFQVTMKRFGRRLDVEAMREKIPLQPYFFDCLYLDGQSLLDASTQERVTALRKLIPEHLSMPSLETNDVELARTFVKRAFDAGHEGAMAKSLHAPYEAGSRGSSWLKIKQIHTLDLIVLDAEWGSGRRRGWLSNLHLGARSDDGQSTIMLGKTFKGLTDKTLKWQTERLLALETHREQHVVHVRPELVVEIAFNDLQSSSQYPGGLALRFARVKQYRDDKSAEDANSMEDVRALATPEVLAE